ncbi:hypothetical protein HK104_002939, partial [Borealophlyctis nickersoniae]
MQVNKCSFSPQLDLSPSPAEYPSPILPYELIRHIAQWSSLTTAARVRCLDRTTARVILKADLILIKAVRLCKRGLRYALSELDYHSVQRHPDIGETLYTTLVKWGAPPTEPRLLMLAICFFHFNVVRAMAAAGVDVLSLFDQEYEVFDEDLTNPKSFKFLVEELGYEPLWHILNRVVRLGQWENAAYLVSRGADPSDIQESAIRGAIRGDFVETLEWLLQNLVDLRAEEMLGYRLEWNWPGSTGMLGTVGFLLQK